MNLARPLKFGVVAAVLGACLAMPAVASAGVISKTFYAPDSGSGSTTSGNSSLDQPSDMSDLDHAYMYAWKIADTTLNGATISQAVLTFNRMYNWDTNTNMLFVDLLDTARPDTATDSISTLAGSDCSGTAQNCVTMYQDDPGNVDTPTDNFLGSYNYLATATTAKYDMTQKSFLGPNQTYSGGAPTAALTDPAGWAHSGTPDSDSGYTYTYTFSATDLTWLNTFLDNPDANGIFDFVLGLDPDCHYYNTGISLALVGSTDSVQGTATAMPEPGSLLLLGTGLIFAARQYRRRKA